MTRTILAILGSLLALSGIAQKKDFYQVVFAADTTFKTPASHFVSASLNDLPINRNIWSAYKTLNNCSETCSKLPLTLLDFWGTPSEGSNVLYWKTTQEANTDHFEVERSMDAREFAKIGTTRSRNTEGKHNYRFVDSYNPSGRSYYRLKMVDIDGQYTYTNIVVVIQETSAQLKVYPNPAGTSVTITLSDGKYLTQLFGSDGRLATSQSSTISTPAGFTLDVGSLPPGIYKLVVTNLVTAANTTKTLVVFR